MASGAQSPRGRSLWASPRLPLPRGLDGGHPGCDPVLSYNGQGVAKICLSPGMRLQRSSPRD